MKLFGELILEHKRCLALFMLTLIIRGGKEMAANQDYIKWIRSKVGHKKIILVFAGGCIFNDSGEVLKWFSLNNLPLLFCKQHEEMALDLLL